MLSNFWKKKYIYICIGDGYFIFFFSCQSCCFFFFFKILIVFIFLHSFQKIVYSCQTFGNRFHNFIIMGVISLKLVQCFKHLFWFLVCLVFFVFFFFPQILNFCPLPFFFFFWSCRKQEREEKKKKKKITPVNEEFVLPSFLVSAF